MLGRYKEIWYGVAIGISTWMLDAMMHVIQRGPISWSAFTNEAIASDSAGLLFRIFFVVVSTALGVSLWRSNRHRCELRELQGLFGAFHRQVVNPVLLIVGYSRMLTLKEGWPVGRESVEMINEIQINAQKINNALKCLPVPLEPSETVETVELIGADSARATVKAYER
jgi:hypothetical protein